MFCLHESVSATITPFIIDVVRFMMRKLFCIKEFILSYANLKISLWIKSLGTDFIPVIQNGYLLLLLPVEA